MRLLSDDSVRTLSHFIFKGTLDEVVEYISSDKAMREICDDVSSIDDSIK